MTEVAEGTPNTGVAPLAVLGGHPDDEPADRVHAPWAARSATAAAVVWPRDQLSRPAEEGLGRDQGVQVTAYPSPEALGLGGPAPALGVGEPETARTELLSADAILFLERVNDVTRLLVDPARDGHDEELQHWGKRRHTGRAEQRLSAVTNVATRRASSVESAHRTASIGFLDSTGGMRPRYRNGFRHHFQSCNTSLIRACLPDPVVPCALNTNTNAGVPGPTWPRSMCIKPRSSDAARRRPASSPFTASLIRLCPARRIGKHGASWIVDNGSSHRGTRAVQRARTWDPRGQFVHTPCHASWLNQIEIYFSIVQRKVLTSNDFTDMAAVADRLRQFERHFAQIGHPFQWTFTRDDLTHFLEKLDSSLADAA